PDGWALIGEGQDHWEAEAVVLTCPAYAQAEMLADLDPQLAAVISGIRYNRIAVVALGFRSNEVPAADGFGFIAPQRLRRDFLGGNAYHGVALNDCTEQGGLLAAQLATWYNKPGR